MRIIEKPVKNYDKGRYGYTPEIIVIHVGDGSMEGAYSWFNNPSSQASSHYMTARNGEIWKFVDVANIAWHAGGVANPTSPMINPHINPNFYSVGIEHEGFSGQTWTNEMYEATAELIAYLCQNLSIPLDRRHVIGHYEINSVGRPNCPGNGVDLNKLISLANNYFDDPMKIQELTQQVNNLKSEVSSLKSQNTKLSSEVNRLTSEVKRLEATTETAELKIQRQKNTQLSQEVARLQKREAELSSEIEKLRKGGGGLTDFINNLFKR